MNREIELMAEGLYIGNSREGEFCPFCRATHEKKFSVKRTEEGILYNCFRASCTGSSGFIPNQSYYERRGEARREKPKNKPFLGRLHDLEAIDVQFFKDTWDIDPKGFKLTDHEEYAFPILDPKRWEKGWIIRQPKWKGKVCPRAGRGGNVAKARTYKNKADSSPISWNIPVHRVGDYTMPTYHEQARHVILVEDVLSAWKITQTGWAVGAALNGVHLGPKGRAEIKEVSPVIVSIWLDPDATMTAYNLLAKHGLEFNSCNVITAGADPKDLSKAELVARIGEVQDAW